MILIGFHLCRNTLQLNSEETMDKLKDADDLTEKMKEALESKTVLLINSSNDLAHSHSELIKSRREINVSFCLEKYTKIHLNRFKLSP